MLCATCTAQGYTQWNARDRKQLYSRLAPEQFQLHRQQSEFSAADLIQAQISSWHGAGFAWLWGEGGDLFAIEVPDDNAAVLRAGHNPLPVGVRG